VIYTDLKVVIVFLRQFLKRKRCVVVKPAVCFPGGGGTSEFEGNMIEILDAGQSLVDH
jgi:hypothetical protein